MSESADSKSLPFDQRLDVDRVFAGLESEGNQPSEAEKQTIREILLRNVRKYNGGSADSSDIGAMFMKFLTGIIHFGENIFKNIGALFSSGKLVDLFQQQTSESLTAAEFKETHNAADFACIELHNQGGNLARWAETITGVSRGDTQPHDWDLYSQLRAGRPAPTSTKANPGPADYTSQNLNYANADFNQPFVPAAVPRHSPIDGYAR